MGDYQLDFGEAGAEFEVKLKEGGKPQSTDNGKFLYSHKWQLYAGNVFRCKHCDAVLIVYRGMITCFSYIETSRGKRDCLTKDEKEVKDVIE